MQNFLIIALLLLTTVNLKAEWFIETSIPYISTSEYPFIIGVAVIHDFEEQEMVNKNKPYTIVLVENGSRREIVPYTASKDQWTYPIEQIDKNTMLIWFRYRSHESKNAERRIKLIFDTNGFHNLDGEEFLFKHYNKNLIANSHDYGNNPPSYTRGPDNEDYIKTRTGAYIKFINKYKSLNDKYCWELLHREYSKGTKLRCRFDKVRVREKPDLSSETITFLKEGEVVTATGNNGGRQSRAELRGKIYFAHFVKVTTDGGKQGWVFNGALEKK